MSMVTVLEIFSDLYQKWNFFVKISMCLLVFITLFLIKNETQFISFNMLLLLNIFFLTIFYILFLIGSLSTLIGWYKFYTIKKDDETPLPNYLLQLSNEMNVDISTYQKSKNFGNAGMQLNSKLVRVLILGDIVLDTLSEGEVSALVAHEFSHKKNTTKEILKLIFGFIISMYVALNYSVNIDRLFLWITILSFLYFIMFPSFWDSELSADEIAVKYTSSDDLANALVKIFPKKIHSHSFSHPSINYRIERLKK